MHNNNYLFQNMKISVNTGSKTKSLKTKSTFDDVYDVDQKIIEVDQKYEQQRHNLQMATSHVFKNQDQLISSRSSIVSKQRNSMKQIQNCSKNENQQVNIEKYEGNKRQIQLYSEEDKIGKEVQKFRKLRENGQNVMKSNPYQSQRIMKNTEENSYKSSQFLSPHILKMNLLSTNNNSKNKNEKPRKNSDDQNFINLLKDEKDSIQLTFNGKPVQKQSNQKVKQSKLIFRQSQILQRCVSYDGGLKIVQNNKTQKNQQSDSKQTRMKLKDYLYMCKSSSKLHSRAEKRANSPKYPKQSLMFQSSLRKQQKYKITNLGMYKIIKNEIFNDLHIMEQRLGKIKGFMQQMQQNDYELSDQQLLVMYNLRNDIKQKIANRVTQSLQIICKDRKLNQLRNTFIQNSFRMDQSKMLEKEEDGDYFCMI